MQMLTNYIRSVIVFGTFILFCLKATVPLHAQQTNTVYIDVALVGDIKLYESFGGSADPDASYNAVNFMYNYYEIVEKYYSNYFNSYNNGVTYEFNLMSIDVMTNGANPIAPNGEYFSGVAIGFWYAKYPCRSNPPDIIHCFSGYGDFFIPQFGNGVGTSTMNFCPTYANAVRSISCHPGAPNIKFKNWSNQDEEIAFKRQRHTVLHEFGHNFSLNELEFQPFYTGVECGQNSVYLMCSDPYGSTGTVLHPTEALIMRNYMTDPQVIACLAPKEVTDVGSSCGHCLVTVNSTSTKKVLAPCGEQDEFTYTTTVQNDCSNSNRRIRVRFDHTKFTVLDASGFSVVPIDAFESELRYIVNNVEQTFPLTPAEEITFNFKFKLNPNYQGLQGAPYTSVLVGQNEITGSVTLAMAKKIGSNGFASNNDLSNVAAIYVDGILQVQSQYGFDFPNLKSIYFAPGGSMEVEFAGLNIKNLTLAGCDQMWKGIVVEPGKKLTMTNLLVYDAQYGVNVLQNAQLTAKGSAFINNNFGIFSNPVSGSASAITLEGNAIFTAISGLKQAYPNQTPAPSGSVGFAGIYVKNANNVLLTENPLSNQLNQITKLKYGLIANNSNVLVNSGRFTNFLPLSKGNGYNAFADAFTPTGTAFVAQQGNFSAIKNSMDHLLIAETPVAILSGNSKITVREATMDKVDWGVISRLSPTGSVVSGNTINSKYLGITSEFALGGNLEVSDNFIQMSSTDPATYGIKISGTDIAALNGSVSRNAVKIDAGQAAIDLNSAKGLTILDNTLQTSGATQFGIRVQGGDQNQVKCNDISGSALGSAAAPATGIYGLMSGRTNYTCNTVSKNTFGMRLEGVAVGKSDKISVAGNTFDDTDTGLELGADAVIGAQTHQGNKWSGTITQAVHLGGEAIVAQSLFTVDAVENPEFFPGIVDPSNWFLNASTPQNSFTCIQGLNCPLPALVGSDVLDRAVADGSLNGLAHQDAQLWLARRRLYERLTGEDNPYANDSDFQRFLLDAQSNGIAAYADMQQDIRQLFQVSTADRNLLNAWDAQLATLADSFAGIERQRALDTLAYADSLALESLRSQTLDTLVYIHGQRSQKLANLQAARSLAAAALITQNNALGGTASYQANEKAVNDILLRTVAMGIDSFSAAQEQALGDIAVQCPLADGEAVLRARALRALRNAGPIVYTDECNEDREQKQYKTDTSFRVFPNPANQMVYLDYRIEGGEARFELWNTLGQVQRSVNLNTADNFGGISTADLPSGIYVYRLMVADKLVQSGSLSIQR